MPVPIDRNDPLYRDDPVISRLTDEQAWALAGLMARLAASVVRRRMAGEAEAEIEAAGVATPTKPPRKRRPSRLAKWEAQWQADAEAES